MKFFEISISETILQKIKNNRTIKYIHQIMRGANQIIAKSVVDDHKRIEADVPDGFNKVSDRIICNR